MISDNNGGTEPTVTAARIDNQHLNNTTTADQIDSQSRLRGNHITLIDHAERLLIDMKSRSPEDGLQVGTLHQLEGKSLHGALCTCIIVFADTHAAYVDFSTGIQVIVDSGGRRSTSMLRPVR